jgi:hypothetical protein
MHTLQGWTDQEARYFGMSISSFRDFRLLNPHSRATAPCTVTNKLAAIAFHANTHHAEPEDKEKTD